MSRAIPFMRKQNSDVPGYPRLSCQHVQGYPIISHLVPSYPPKGYPRIPQDIPRQDSCIGISHYKFSVLGYPGLSRDKHHIGLSRDIPLAGYPFMSFFQMNGGSGPSAAAGQPGRGRSQRVQLNPGRLGGLAPSPDLRATSSTQASTESRADSELALARA